MMSRYRSLLAGSVVFLVAVGCLFPWAAAGSAVGNEERPAAVGVEATWRTELEELCAGTSNAMSFSREELQRRIALCDRLKTRIENLDESSRKVYGRRLQMCRDFYRFLLESKPGEGI
jgi:hypothetical protein